MTTIWLLRALAPVLLAASASMVGAQGRLPIAVGQTAGFSGPVSASVRETAEGAKLYLAAVNAAGGVNGQTIDLVSMDDHFDPKLAAANAKQLLEERHVIALFLTRGTPHAQAMLPLLGEYRVPLVAPSTGAMLLHEPIHPWVFNVRATYQREAERAVAHLNTLGTTRVGIVQTNDSFGADAAAGAMKGLTKAQLQPAFVVMLDRAKPAYGELQNMVKAKDPQAVLFLASGQTAADAIRAMRAAGSKAQAVTLSNNASAGFVQALGDAARGTVVSQVFPSERALSIPMVKQLTDLASAKGIQNVSPAMMEGFAAAKVLVEGLKRAGPKPDGAKLAKALDGLSRFDLGGLELGYSASDHTGLEYVDLAIIGADGKFKR